MDLLYLHPSATRRKPSFLFMPAGVFPILNHARRHGFAVSAVNEAVELALDPHFDTAQFLATHPAQVYAIDLHWHEHAHGALSLARLIKERRPDAVVVLGGITCPESAVNPEILPDVRVAVQWNMIPGSFPNKGMLVDSPVQIDFNRGGLLVTTGSGVVISCTVSFPVHPLPFVTFTQ